MSIQLGARTPAGAGLVAAAEAVAYELAAAAPEHDRDASYPFEGIASLQRAGFFAAPVPAELGGLGVESLHDLVVASSRIARGDASVAIGVNMHLAVLTNIARRWRAATSVGDVRRAAAFGETLTEVAHENSIIATAVSEPGQDLTHPVTTATRTATGWRVDGAKIFCTMSPAATVLFTTVSFFDEDGDERYGYARIPTATPGVVVHDDWDALGMRASGSHSVTFDEVQLPASALRGGFPVGSRGAYLEANLTAGLFHAASSLGIAESAQEIATRPLADRDLDARAQMLVAEGAIALGAARASLARAALLTEAYLDEGEGVVDEVFAEIQGAKTFINETAVRIVDGALALTGGAGYRATHPLAKLYRDVRAGAFMHPLGANRAYEFVGEVALGRQPSVH
jgi:alkylation response protein AidB-like acyl-CoA dehydrogenase